MTAECTTITVQVIGEFFTSLSNSSNHDYSSSSSERTEDLSLQVALHSPLLVRYAIEYVNVNKLKALIFCLIVVVTMLGVERTTAVAHRDSNCRSSSYSM